MNEITDFQAAENDLFSCAVFLTDKIRNAGGRDEAIKSLTDNLLENGDVDRAAEFADSIDDNFERDRLLISVAEKCAEIEDYEYAVQIAEAIEDEGFQSDALERIAIFKAKDRKFEEASELVRNLRHADTTKGVIALEAYEFGDENFSLQIFKEIEDPAVKANIFGLCAVTASQKKLDEKAEHFLQTARDEALKTELPEERIYSLLSTAYSCGDSGRKDIQIEILGKAQKEAEKLDGVHRNHLLSLISSAFLDAGSIDLADKTLDAVNDKTVIASTLSAYAVKFHEKGELHEALDALEESIAILESQTPGEVRDSQAAFKLSGNISVNFANFGKFSRAIELASENPSEFERISALKQIGRLAALQGNKEDMKNAIENIPIDTEKTAAMITHSNALAEINNHSEALKMLEEAREVIPSTAQVTAKIALLKSLCVGFKNLSEENKARETAQEILELCSKINDDSLKATEIAYLSTLYKKFGYKLTSDEKMILREILLKADK